MRGGLQNVSGGGQSITPARGGLESRRECAELDRDVAVDILWLIALYILTAQFA